MRLPLRCCCSMLAPMRSHLHAPLTARVETCPGCLQTRVALTKDERKALRAKQRAGLSGAALLEDFGDDVAGLLGHGGAGEAAYHDKVRLGQQFGGAANHDAPAAPSGGALWRSYTSNCFAC